MEQRSVTPPPIRVLLCEDQTLMRQGLRTILDLEPGLLVGGAGSATEVVAQAQAMQPDIVLMDVQLRGRSGIEATAEISRLLPHSRVIILTTFDYDQYLLEGLRAGAAGFLLKDGPADELIRTIRRVHAGEASVPPNMAARPLTELGRKPTAAAPDALTERDLDVLRLLADGASNRAIGDRLSLAEGTVKNYVSSILDKLGATNRTQAVGIARRQHLLA